MSVRRTFPRLIPAIGVLACVSACHAPDEPKGAPDAAATVAVQSAPSSSASAAPSADPARSNRRGSGGVDAILYRAASDLPLNDDQRTKLNAVLGNLSDRDNPRAMMTFAHDLADQVKAGKIDGTKFQADQAALDAAMATNQEKQATVLTNLHDALDASQRKAVADAVHAQEAARDAQQATVDAGGLAADWVARRLARMTKDLGLDDGQQKQVGALLAKQPPPTAAQDDLKKQIEAVVAAFQADTFDAAKVLKATSKTPREAMDRQITFTKQLLAILQPDQRDKLAATMTRPMRRGSPWAPNTEPPPE